MRKTIFTPKEYFARFIFNTMMTLLIMVGVSGWQNIHAQCALACNKATQVSLDENCEAEVTPNMILNADTTICPNGRFGVVISYHGRPIPTTPVVTCDYIGQELEVMIVDSTSGNSCWGNITIEDKLPPRIECGNDTLYCYQMPKYTGPNITDNCTKAAYVTEVLNVNRYGMMDEAYGIGNWDSYIYSTLSIADLLSCKYDVIVLNGVGSNAEGNGDQLRIFFNNYRTQIENWVNEGGSLYVNAGATGGYIDLGFNGTGVGASVNSDTAYVADKDHAIFCGPFLPTSLDYSGKNALLNQIPVARTIVCPPTMKTLMVSENDDVLLAEMVYGSGLIMIDALRGSNAIYPQPAGYNFRYNILEYLRVSSPKSVQMTLLDERPFPFGCASREFVKRIERDYQATDASGNKSAVCTQTIYLRRFPVDSVDCPKEWTIADDCPVSCEEIAAGNIPTLPNGAPTPEWAGVPTIDGIALWPPQDFYCNVTVTYEDIVLPKIGCVTKIMRMWTISEWWCNQDFDRQCRQLIEIVDTTAPEFVCPNDIVTTTNGGYECEADVILPPVHATDLCAGVSRIDVRYPGGFLRGQNGGLINLSVGIHDVTYFVYDDCYNVDSCTIQVTVEDNTPPVAVCDRYTVVGLTYDSVAHVYAETFDDGTYDDCKLYEFKVKRMDNGAGCGRVDTAFKDYVEFCCNDIGQNVMVIFRAYDKSHNYNECMVEVEVQDKVLPHIYCPPNITISCDYHFDLADLGASFGNVVDKKANRQPIVIDDPNASWDGQLIDGHAYDNCFVSISEDTSVHIDQCNTGYITRTFTATDANGSVSCTQTITIQNFHPFDGTTDITWPLSFDTTGCLDPNDLTEDVTGKPIFNEDACDLVGYSFEDHVFPFFNSQKACLKIIRKWKVIDWCQFVYDPQTGRYDYDTYEFEQVIKVTDVDDPFFVSVTPDSMFCSFDTTCIEGPATLIAEADDDCTPAVQLKWEYYIDLNADGHYELDDSGYGGVIDASGDYPFGDHKIKYVFEDRCGNKITEIRDFSIINCKAPTPYCKNGIVIELMPMDTNRDGTVDLGMIEVWASDLDLGSFGPCGNPVTVSFSADTTDKNRMFDCDSIGQRNVEIWVTDRLTGNQAFCRTFIIIQDNSGACSGNFNGGAVSGLVRTEDDKNVKEASISLQGSSFNPVMTQGNGAYAFPMMPFGGNYKVIATKDDLHLEGISTKDLIIIQRHLLGMTKINSPYKLIAADVNNDSEVSVGDISELRKLILGVYPELPNNTSFRFIDKTYVFPNPQDPFHPAYPEHYSIDNFVNNMGDVDFMAMKVGDLDGSANVGGINNNGTRSNLTFNMVTSDQVMRLGQETMIEFRAKNLENISGYQFTLNFDAQLMEFAGIEAGKADMTSENLGLTYLNEGMINVSWYNVNGVAVAPEDILFTARFVAHADVQLSDVISINSRMTKAEAYNVNDEVMNVEFGFRGKSNADISFRLYQNHPNPFNDNTIIGFDLPEDGNVILTIYDVTGKVVSIYNIDGQKGYNSTEILSKELSATGVLYYQLDTNGYTATKKMVVLQ